MKPFSGNPLGVLLSAAGERDAASSGAADMRRSWLARRPSLPPLLFLAAALWAGDACAIEVLFGVAASCGVSGAGTAMCRGALVAALLAAAGAAACFARQRPLVGCLALGLALGIGLGAVHAERMCLDQRMLLAGDAVRICELEHDSRTGEFGASATARIAGGPRVALNLPVGTRLLAGDRIVVRGPWKVPSGASAPARWRSGTVATATVRKVEVVSPAAPLAPVRALRQSALAALRAQAPDAPRLDAGWAEEAALLLAAVALGYADGLYESALYQAVKVDGLAHMVAVSGAHLVIVCGVAALALRRLSLPRPASIAIQISFVLGYLVLAGAPVSAVRAAAMSAISALSFFGARRPYALGALAACVVAMIAADPAAAFSTSLLLSATATLGIILFSGFFGELLGTVLRLPEGFVRDAVALTFASSLATGPISACLFSQVSLVAPLANVAGDLAFPPLCIGGLAVLFAAAAIPPAASVLIGCALVPVQLFVALLHALACIPGASCPAALPPPAAALFAIGLPALIWVSWPRPRALLLAVPAGIIVGCALSLVLAPLARGDTVTMLDVGQGDAILVQSGGRSLLVDTGTQDAKLLAGLASCGVVRLDAVLVTHADDDHCGSLPALRGVVDVGCVLVGAGIAEQRDGKCAGLCADARELAGAEGLRELSVGDVIALGDLRLEVVGPDRLSDAGGNADSLVVLLTRSSPAGTLSGLLCGDAEADVLEGYREKGRIGDIDLLKVGHHGSRASVDDGLLAALRPEVALVSAGSGNRYGHPTPEALACLGRAGSAVFRTDEDGAITCALRDSGLAVHCER